MLPKSIILFIWKKKKKKKERFTTIKSFKATPFLLPYPLLLAFSIFCSKVYWSAISSLACICEALDKFCTIIDGYLCFLFSFTTTLLLEWLKLFLSSFCPSLLVGLFELEFSIIFSTGSALSLFVAVLPVYLAVFWLWVLELNFSFPFTNPFSSGFTLPDLVFELLFV